jgi:hypothetical protein
MDALVAKAELDLPKASVQAEVERLLEGARAELKQRGIKDADKAPIPDDVFRPRPSAACAWAWSWPNWCVPMNCMPSPSSCKRPCRGTGRQLREAGRRGALVLQRQPPHGRGRGRGHREQRRPSSCWARPR